MTWTRLERAALDYVIAGLARFGWASTEVDDLPPEARAAVLAAHYTTDPQAPGRLGMARLNLYLRLLRRVDAWERDDGEWPGWACPDGYGLPADDFAEDGVVPETAWFPIEAWRWASEGDLRLAPWHPLWLDAPPYDPAVTPRMRREARREKLARAVNEWAKANMPSIEDLCPPLFPEPRKRGRHGR